MSSNSSNAAHHGRWTLTRPPAARACGAHDRARAPARQPTWPTDPAITVHEDNGVYRVAATFGVPQSASMAVAVLTDYEQIPRFMPDVRTSNVSIAAPDHVVVEQEAVAHLMMFSKRIHLVLEVREQAREHPVPRPLRQKLHEYEGSWTLTEKGGQTAISYELNAQPSFDVPEWLLKRLLKRDATRMIQRLQTEIASRAR